MSSSFEEMSSSNEEEAISSRGHSPNTGMDTHPTDTTNPHLDLSLSPKSKRRKRQKKHEEKIDNLCDKTHIEYDLNRVNAKHSKTCSGQCHEELTVDKVYTVRVDIHRKTMGTARKEQIIQYIHQTRINNCHIVQGVSVCIDYWWSIVAKITKNTYRKAVTLANKGVHHLSKRTNKTKKISKEDAALAFMNMFIQGHSDIDPSTSSKKLLPVGTTIKKIHELYCKHEEPTGIKGISYRRFCQIWREKIAHKISFCTLGKIAICDICVQYEQQTTREKDDIKLAQLEREWSKHKQKQLLVAFYNLKLSLLFES
jgi:hypothetical protein